MFTTIILITTQLLLADAFAPFQDQGQRGPGGRGPSARPNRTGRGGGQKDVVQVYQLRYADCEKVAEVLRQVLQIGTITAEPRTNVVIVSGTPEVRKLTEDILQQLDHPPQVAKAETDFSAVRIKHRSAKDVAKRVESILNDRHVNIVSDAARSTILLNGTEEKVARAHSVIQQLDIPAAVINLEFSFFKARLHTDDDTPTAIPSDLRDVVAEVKRFGRVEFLGRLSTVATEETGFEVAGKIADMISAHAHGSLLRGSEDGTVKLRFEAEMKLFNDPDADTMEKKIVRRQAPSAFQVESTLITRRGDYVVLGSAPTGWEIGESAILVLHVRD